MTTLTITAAKKNLGKWLSAAVNGQEVRNCFGRHGRRTAPGPGRTHGLRLAGSGLSEADLDTFIRADNKRIAATQRAGKLVTLPGNLKESLEKISAHRSGRAKATSRTTAKRARRSRS